ncbi:acyl-CoA carboxylase subunit beta [Corynebacterium sp. TAE3-ERU12]|uniref:acyl-CoA carboxylase subunit beta n=1 Tax=Corynebacterium sp. TAE3-ERU12 TaxID=2849491 RepID=UPI001C44DA54|nr:carboxyl transferase domain-containing protein [Corynebacterium sp. TAE3-ERU12]MBV7295578.1 acyl-CoA carboxylase subunit beta [Corynebacterium sp. TAE3-ERU12]
MSTAADAKTTAGKLADLQRRLAKSRAPLGEDALAELRDTGRLTARDQVTALLDEDSFVEIDALARRRGENPGPVTDGAITGYGTVDGRPVCVAAQDATIENGQLGEVSGEKIAKVIELAVKSGTPVVTFYTDAGTREADDVAALGLQSRIFAAAANASGVVPQVAVVSGPRSQDVHPAELADVVIGAGSGPAYIEALDDAEAVRLAREVLSYLPSNNRAEAPRYEVPPTPHDDPVLDSIVPDDGSGYGMAEVLFRIADDAELLPLGDEAAPSMLTTFARIDGAPVGVVATEPKESGGVVTGEAAEKAARFVRTCDAFHIPVVLLVDTCGFADEPGIARRGAKLAYALAEATVGRVTVITGQATGTAYSVLGAKGLGTDVNLAWPTARIGHGDDPYVAAARGDVDAVIPPAHTRPQLIESLHLLQRKAVPSPERKHGNQPL